MNVSIAILLILGLLCGCTTRQAWEGAPAAGQELISREISPDLFDTAHFRDWADWTVFLAATIARTVETGTVIELTPEGGARRITVKPIDEQFVRKYGLARTVVPLAQWLAFQVSLWHEIATWYGWSALNLFPERASAFSPEDLYSNLLGIRTAGVLIYAYSASSESVYGVRRAHSSGTTAVPLLSSTTKAAAKFAAHDNPSFRPSEIVRVAFAGSSPTGRSGRPCVPVVSPLL